MICWITLRFVIVLLGFAHRISGKCIFETLCDSIGGLVLSTPPNSQSCFKRYPNALSWKDAWSICGDKLSNPDLAAIPGASGRLAWIRSSESWTQLRYELSNTTHTWIGLRTYDKGTLRSDHSWTSNYHIYLKELFLADDTDRYSWNDNDNVTKYSNIPGECMKVFSASDWQQPWSRSDCVTPGFDYLCEYYTYNLTSMKEACESNLNGTYFDGSCYKLYAGAKPFSDRRFAHNTCINYAMEMSRWHTGRLAYLRNETIYTIVRQYLNGIINHHYFTPWIGLVGNGVQRTNWHWGDFGQDGNPAMHTDFPVTWGPDNITEQFVTNTSGSNCGLMTYSPNGWKNTDCSFAFSFLCEYRDDSSCASLAAHQPKNCDDIKMNNRTAISGEYVIIMTNCTDGVKTMPSCCTSVYCDMTSFGGGWLDFQRRLDSTTDFRQSWNSYADGFMYPTAPGGYYLDCLGNDYINIITTAMGYELLVVLKPFEVSCFMWAKYSLFKVTDRCDQYRLILGSYLGGTLGDALKSSSNVRFSTYDKDLSSSNCATTYNQSGWLHSCFAGALNGDYPTNTRTPDSGCMSKYASGISWLLPRGFFYSYQQAFMKLRPVNSMLHDASMGNFCSNISVITEPEMLCSQDCGWLAWSPWSSCNATCGSGIQKRTRLLQNATHYQAMQCPVNATESQTVSQTCSGQPCPVNCTWTTWSPWGQCSVTCGTGTQVATRSKQIVEQNGGICFGTDASTQTCTFGNCDTIVDVDKNVSVAVKVARRSLQTFGCAWIIGLTASVFGLFLFFGVARFRQFSHERVLHMCQEISLCAAHVIIVLSINNELQLHKNLCIFSAALLQYLFTVHFAFILLESVQTYCVMTNVISGGGFFTRKCNLALGWGIPAVYVLLMAGWSYKYYNAPRSCWLNLGHDISLSTLVPVALLSMATLVIVEATSMSTLKRLPLMDVSKRTNAMLSRTGLLFILPLTTAAWFVGQYAMYSGLVEIYSIVFILNICAGVAIVKFHIVQNEQVRRCMLKLLFFWKKSKPTTQA